MTPTSLITAAERLLVARPPPGLGANDLRGFLDRHRARLVAVAGAALSSVLLPAHVRRERIITLNLGLGRASCTPATSPGTAASTRASTRHW